MVVAGETPPGAPGLIAAVRRLIHHLVGALAQVARLEDVEVKRVLDVSVGVPRRELKIDDPCVLLVERIDFGESLAGELLVLPDVRPGVAAEGRRLYGGDDKPGH